MITNRYVGNYLRHLNELRLQDIQSESQDVYDPDLRIPLGGNKYPSDDANGYTKPSYDTQGKKGELPLGGYVDGSKNNGGSVYLEYSAAALQNLNQRLIIIL